MGDEEKEQVKLLLETVAQQQVQMGEQQSMLAELLDIIRARVGQMSPTQGVAQSAVISQPEPEPEPMVQDVQENIPDVPGVQDVQENIPDVPVVQDFQEDIPEVSVVQEVIVMARQVHDESVPALHEYVLESYDPREPLPVLSEESQSAHSGPVDDFMGDNSYYDWVFSGESSDHFGDKYKFDTFRAFCSIKRCVIHRSQCSFPMLKYL